MSDFAKDIVSREKEIKRLKRHPPKEVRNIRKEMYNFGFIASFADVRLYYDRIQQGNRVLKIDSGIEAAADVDGNVYVTTKTTGGGARPTLTRVAVGAMVAGPIGALIGGAAQKKKKVKTSNEVHDTRVYRVMITSKDGAVSASSTTNSNPQAFVTAVLNAVADYPHKKEYYANRKKELKARATDILKADPAVIKQKELKKIMSNATSAEKSELDEYRKKIKRRKYITIGAAIVALFIIGLIINSGGSNNSEMVNDLNSTTVVNKEDTTGVQATNEEPESNQASQLSQVSQSSDAALNKCILMEAADIITTGIGGKSGDPYVDARKTCEGWRAQWSDFNEIVEEDWQNRQNEIVGGQTLSERLKSM